MTDELDRMNKLDAECQEAKDLKRLLLSGLVEQEKRKARADGYREGVEAAANIELAGELRVKELMPTVAWAVSEMRRAIRALLPVPGSPKTVTGPDYEVHDH